jgi:hypothetical protein
MGKEEFIMGDQFSEDVNQMFAESLSQINSSFNHLSNMINIFEKAMNEQDYFSIDDIFIVERDIDNLRDSISELKRMADRKRGVLIIKK